MQQKGVNHILVSPHHPQSNGMAEKYVGIVKQLFLKAREEGKDPNWCITHLQIYTIGLQNTKPNGNTHG